MPDQKAILKRTYIRLYYHEFDAEGTPIDKFKDLTFFTRKLSENSVNTGILQVTTGRN